MNTTRTDHSPNNPSHPTPRARDLRERLDSAADEGLSQNISRFLRFLGHKDGDVIELQALGVPGKYGPIHQFTHVSSIEDAIGALEHEEGREPVGSSVLFNAVDPAVATRAASGFWHQAKRGESTTDRDVRARRALYIDVDAERASGTSATDEELGHAFAKAADILAWLEERVPSASIGVGHSGNGASLFVALDHVPERPELARSVKALLAGLDHRFSDARAKVDRSVSDAKRLCPAFGTTKRKGAAGIAERPHRRTAFVCAEQIERLDEAALTTLVQSLRDELDDEGRSLMDRELGITARAPASTASACPAGTNAWQLPRTTSPFALANAVPVADVVAWLGLDEGDGRVRCPGCGLLVRVANWLRVTRDEETVSVAPPGDVSRDLLTYPPRELPEIQGVVTTPVFGADGSLVTTAGYHARERLWLHVDPALGPIGVPSNPSRANIAFARDLFLKELLVDFPFVADGDRAHALAAFLLPFARRLIDGPTPLHVLEAPAAGSGKGLIATAIQLVATGTSSEPRSLSPVEEECRKMLTAELTGGKSIILLDNVSEKRVLDSAPLASVLTSEVWRDRVLGETRMVSLPNRALWLMSGNNPRFSLEIARRCVRIRIDAKRDMPWRRAGFKHDPLIGWVRENRGLLVRAALVLVQAWIAAGRPRCSARLGSFESWAAVVGGILEVAEVPGFLGNTDDFYESSDAEGGAWRELVALWWERSKAAPLRVADVNALCAERELFEDLRGDGTERSQQTKLGKALQASRDRVFGGFRIQLVRDDKHKGRSYVLVPVGEDGERAAPAIGERVDDAQAGPTTCEGEVDPWAA